MFTCRRNKQGVRSIFYLAVSATLIIFTGITAQAELVMGVFPRRPVAATVSMFKPLAQVISEEMGEPVKIVVKKDFKEFWAGVINREFDLVHFNQYHYLLGKKVSGYKVIAVNEEFGRSRIAGALTVRKDAGIQSISDLKGKKIVFGGGPKAMGSYIAPTSLLKTAGLSASDYVTEFAKNPPSAVMAVYNKACDASGSGDVILQIKIVQNTLNTDELMILAKSKEYVQLPWAVRGDMDPAKAEEIQRILTSLKERRDDVLKKAKVTNFVKASDDDFTEVKEIVRHALGEEY